MLRPLTSPPRGRSRYVDSNAYHAEVKSGHTDGIKKFRKYKPGTWRRDTFKGIHGHEISELRHIPISSLETPEIDSGKLHPSKRAHAEEYASRLKKGHEGPPIEVVQTDAGTLRVIDGHRRLVAHQMLGRKKIKAWISYAAPHPEGLKDSEGRTMHVGMTHEMVHGDRITESPVPADYPLSKSDGHGSLQSVEQVKRDNPIHRDLGNGYTLHRNRIGKEEGDIGDWFVQHGDKIVGYGSMSRHRFGLSPEHSVISPLHQGKGVYPAILRHYNEQHGLVGSEMSRGAKRAWHRAFGDRIHVHKVHAALHVPKAGSDYVHSDWRKATKEELDGLAAKEVKERLMEMIDSLYEGDLDGVTYTEHDVAGYVSPEEKKHTDAAKKFMSEHPAISDWADNKDYFVIAHHPKHGIVGVATSKDGGRHGVEIGYAVHHKLRRKGMAGELVRRIEAANKKFGVSHFHAEAVNDPSIGVLKKSGYKSKDNRYFEKHIEEGIKRRLTPPMPMKRQKKLTANALIDRSDSEDCEK